MAGSGSGTGSGTVSPPPSPPGGGGGGGALPSGYLSSGDQSTAFGGFFAPINCSKVRFTCHTNAAITPGYQVGTRSAGYWSYKASPGTLGFATIIDVPLQFSGVNVEVSFKTTDSNGGYCNWQAMA